jgi:hypothetical protein
MAHETLKTAVGLLALSASSWFANPAGAQEPEPVGSEFLVNSYTTGAQTLPAVATGQGGEFVVVWRSTTDIRARRFDSGANGLGSEFLVSSYTTAFADYPQVATDAGGNFVVVWESYGQDGSDFGIFGRRFDSGGTSLGATFRVNSYTNGAQRRPRVATDASGGFVVVWESYGQDGSKFGIFGRRFDSGGNPLGSDFQVNSYTTSFQFAAAIGTDASGNFVVVWESLDHSDGVLGRIVGRRFDSGGSPLGSDFRVNSYTTGAYVWHSPRIVTNASGGFVVVWVGPRPDGHGIVGRRFDSGGSPLGSDFLVNSFTFDDTFRPQIGADASGTFVVVWESNGQDGSSYGVFGRRFDSGASPLGSEFQVNSYVTGYQSRPAVATDTGGNFVVVWASMDQDGSGYGVFGQRFLPPDLIFTDGVESGDLTRWSASATDGTDLRPTVAAAMAGTGFGIQASVNDTNSLYVQDDTPIVERRYRARFYFDPNGFDPGEAMSHFRTRIFIAFDPSGLRVVTLVLKRQGGAYSIETRVRRNDGTRADTGFFPISDGPHFVEFDWRRATGPGASDGSLEMWIDGGMPAATLSGIDNDLSSVDFARLGALAIKTGAAGTLFFDQFESRRRTYVGP